MRVLLDTHIALWAVLKTERLSPETFIQPREHGNSTI